MCRVTLRTTDNIPANFVQNQFGVDTGEDSFLADDVTAALKTFYDAINGPLLSDVFAQNGHLIKFYSMPGLTPNYPFAERTWNFASAPAGSTLPSEVALVLSFQGSRAAGFPQARRRGRIYIGPLFTTVNSTGRPRQADIDALCLAASDLEDDIRAIPGHVWSIWSTVDQDMVEVQNGWVDNAFDTQRRRGIEVTARTVWD